MDSFNYDFWKKALQTVVITNLIKIIAKSKAILSKM